MARFIVFLLPLMLLIAIVKATESSISSTTESPENESDVEKEKNTEMEVDKVKINGKTYFFQLRKDEQGNETVYKKVKPYRNEGLEEQVEVDVIVEEENPREKFSPFESLKNRRRDFLKSERVRQLQNVHFLDNEWRYNSNNQYLEIPEVARELYRAMRDEYQAMRDMSTIRILFETSPDEENILKFNLDCVRNKSNEVVVDAELLVFRSSEMNETKTNEGNLGSDHLIRLYQVVPINETDENVTQNPDLHKLLNVIYVSSRDSSWQVFKVESIIQNWLNGEENLGFLLSATDSWENTVPLNIGRKYHGKIQPMLILYINKRNQRVTATANLPKPNRRQMERYLSFSKNTNTLPTNPTGCNKHVWYISFQELGWNNFILAPYGFMAFRCKGSCFTPIISPFTNHALLKFMYQGTYSYLRKPCCVPDTMKPLTIMYIDNNQNVAIKMYEDMIVDGCGCR